MNSTAATWLTCLWIHTLGMKQSTENNMTNLQCTDAKVKISRRNNKPFQKQKHHLAIFIPEQAQAVTGPTAVYYSCISQ